MVENAAARTSLASIIRDTTTTNVTGGAAATAAAVQPATPTTVTTGGSFTGGNVGGAIAALSAARKGGKDELVLYQKVGISSNSQGANPWLLELPDPVTRATWGNYAMISLAKAKELGIKLDSDYEYYMDKPVIEVGVNGKKVQLPDMWFRA